jgi:hypothetical protein
MTKRKTADFDIVASLTKAGRAAWIAGTPLRRRHGFSSIARASSATETSAIRSSPLLAPMRRCPRAPSDVIYHAAHVIAHTDSPYLNLWVL